MNRRLMLTFSNPASADAEAEYHEWYSGTHIPQLLTHVEGMRSAQRYRVLDEGALHRFLVVYEVEGRPEDIMGGVAAGMASGRLSRSASLEADPPPRVVFVEELDDDAAGSDGGGTSVA